MQHCTNCGTQVNANASFCLNCGQQIERASSDIQVETSVAPTPTSGLHVEAKDSPPINVNTEFCVKCGTSIPAESAFCTSCGTPRKQAGEPLKISDALENRARNAMILEMAGIVGLLGIGHLYSGRKGLGIGMLIGWFIIFWPILVPIMFTGVFACIVLPVNIGVSIYSGIQARDYVRAQN